MAFPATEANIASIEKNIVPKMTELLVVIAVIPSATHIVTYYHS